MYGELEAILLKYIDSSLLITEEELNKNEINNPSEIKEYDETTEDKPVVLVINNSSDKLKEFKDFLSEKYKGVLVKDEASAEKFMKNHKVEFVVRDGSI